MGNVLINLLVPTLQFARTPDAPTIDSVLAAYPISRDYFDAVDAMDVKLPARQQLLRFGNTGFLGAYRQPSFKSLEARFNRSLTQNKTGACLKILDQIGQLGDVKSHAFLGAAAETYLLRATLEKSAPLPAYRMSRMGLCALRNLAKSKSPSVLTIARDLLTGKKGIIIFDPQFSKEPFLALPTHPTVLCEILDVLCQIGGGPEAASLLKDLLRIMDYDVQRSASVVEGFFNDEQRVVILDSFPTPVEVERRVYETVILYKEGGLFLNLLQKSPNSEVVQASMVALLKGLSNLQFAPNDAGNDPLHMVRDGLRVDIKTSRKFSAMQNPAIMKVVFEEFYQMLQGKKCMEVIDELIRMNTDAAAQLLINRYKALDKKSPLRGYIVCALEQTHTELAAQFFEEERDRTFGLRFWKREKLAARAKRTRSSK